MNPFSDASFLVSFFSTDSHTPRARRWWFEYRPIIRTARLAYFEAENAIRSMRVSGLIQPEEEFEALENMKRFILEGMLELWETPVKRLFPSARRLSQFHTTDRSFGAMDILHVASALEMKASCLLSFDDRQKELAESEGIKTAPV